MNDHSIDNLVPWNLLKEEIKEISIEGISTIGSYSFYQMNSVEEIVVGERIETIGSHAFDECTSLTTLTIKSTSSLYIDWICIL